MGSILSLHAARPLPPRPHPKLHLAARALVAGLLLLISGIALA